MRADLTLTVEEARVLYGALSVQLFILESQNRPASRVRSLQGRVDVLWRQLEHIERAAGRE